MKLQIWELMVQVKHHIFEMDKEICPETCRRNMTKSCLGHVIFFLRADRTGLQFSSLILKSSHLTKCILLCFTHLGKERDELVLMTADLKQKKEFHFGGEPP